MDREQIRQLLEYLAEHRSDFYRDFLTNIDSATAETQEKIWKSLERQKFEDREDVIVYFEGEARI